MRWRLATLCKQHQVPAANVISVPLYPFEDNDIIVEVRKKSSFETLHEGPL